MIARAGSSGKSIVMIVTISYFLSSTLNIQLAHLQTLAAVARHGSFSRAARELRLTQPAVSMQVRLLERELGCRCSSASARGRTPQGGRAAPGPRRPRRAGARAGPRGRAAAPGIVAGRIRLGTSASFSIYLLPSALRRFRARYPRTELVVVTGNAPEIARAVVANELDVGIVSLPVRERELAVTSFHRDELVAIGPPRRRWPRGRRAKAAELAREPLILFERGATLRRVIGCCRVHRQAPRRPCRWNQLAITRRSVAPRSNRISGSRAKLRRLRAPAARPAPARGPIATSSSRWNEVTASSRSRPVGSRSRRRARSPPPRARSPGHCP